MKRKSLLAAIIASLAILIIMSFKPIQADNMLTESEKKAGWKLLFDGKSTDGWRTYKNNEQDSWEIVNGQMHTKNDEALKHSDLITKDQYKDFELQVDW